MEINKKRPGNAHLKYLFYNNVNILFGNVEAIYGEKKSPGTDQ